MNLSLTESAVKSLLKITNRFLETVTLSETTCNKTNLLSIINEGYLSTVYFWSRQCHQNSEDPKRF